MSVRVASHAGSWYTEDGAELTAELDQWLQKARAGEVDPQPGARVIIAPHAGYRYSGPAAAWAYKSLDLSQAKRVFLLGPSHHKFLSGCALSKHTRYATPLGNLSLDLETIAELRSTGKFEDMSSSTDSAEHSLEMHLPYIYHVLSKSFTEKDLPPLVPILVGSTRPATEEAFGALLAPYLADSSNVFVVSSDFCHWGARFSYTYYVPSSAISVAEGRSLSKRESPSGPPIHESIARIDRSSMEAVESGQHHAFLQNLNQTGNTVCGRHPIGVLMAAVETLKRQDRIEKAKGLFKFVRYERSDDILEASDSSVSYASAYAVL